MERASVAADVQTSPWLSGDKTRGTFGVFYTPASGKPETMTFSLYARGENSGATLTVKAERVRQSFRLTGEWQR